MNIAPRNPTRLGVSNRWAVQSVRLCPNWHAQVFVPTPLAYQRHPRTEIASTSDVEIGEWEWDFNTKTISVGGGVYANAVRISVRRGSGQSPSNTLLFAPFFGVNHASMSVVATTAFEVTEDKNGQDVKSAVDPVEKSVFQGRPRYKHAWGHAFP